jgi:hypothetical protein
VKTAVSGIPRRKRRLSLVLKVAYSGLQGYCTLHGSATVLAVVGKDPQCVKPRLALPYRKQLMGKYFLGWLLGVPVIVLAVIYIIFNH